jgi:hypothetical protein
MKTITIKTETQTVEIILDQDACFEEMMYSYVGALITLGFQYGSFETYVCEQYENIKEWE